MPTFRLVFPYDRELVQSEPLVDVVDAEAGMSMFCYRYGMCSPSSSELMRRSRGVIFSGNNVILPSFPYTTEYTTTNLPDIDFATTRLFQAYEGCIVRVFHRVSPDNPEGRWFIVTNRKFDACASKWGSNKSFGQAFLECLPLNPSGEKFTLDELLDKNCSYFFMVRNTSQNRVVCDGVGGVLLIGRLKNGDTEFQFGSERAEFMSPQELKFNNVDELVAYVDSISPYKCSGVVGFSADGIFKITNDRYAYLSSLRGNEPSVMFRYLQLREGEGVVPVPPVIDSTVDSQVLFDFMTLYPDRMETIALYEKTLQDCARYIYSKYVERCVHHTQNTVTPEENTVIRACHSWYKANRTPMTIEKLLNIMETIPIDTIPQKSRAVFLNHLIQAELKRQRE